MVRSTSNGGRHIRSDGSPRTCHRSKDVLTQHEVRTYYVLRSDIFQNIRFQHTYIMIINHHIINIITIIRSDRKCKVFAAQHQRITSGCDCAVFSLLYTDIVGLLGEKCLNRLISRPICARHRTSGNCAPIDSVNNHGIYTITIFWKNGIGLLATAGNRCDAGRQNLASNAR